ncbi:MAG: DNA methyltransferase [Anaerolineales bacterium]
MGEKKSLPLNKIITGDAVEVMKSLPPGSIDLIFADPPYNLQLKDELWRPDLSKVDAVDDEWDQFENFKAYDRFSRAWLSAAKRLLSENGSLWVIGSYHNIYRVGKILQDLGLWILNEIVWVKTNPMPNFHGVRFTNAHETLIWAKKSEESRYTFNYHAMKAFNHGKQMRSDWLLPICKGKERVRIEGETAHSTQKPEALLYRVLVSSTNPGDVVLDPFFGTGTSGVVAKRLHRQWIGIERNPTYVKVAQERIETVQPEPYQEGAFDIRDKKRLAPRIPFSRLLEHGYLKPGQRLYFQKKAEQAATLKPNGKLRYGDYEGSIHQTARHIQNGSPINGWDHWYFKNNEGEMVVIDRLRERFREKMG